MEFSTKKKDFFEIKENMISSFIEKIFYIEKNLATKR